MPRPNRNSATARQKLPTWIAKSRLLAFVATTLLLSLFVAGCVHSRSEIRPAVHQGPQGNAVLATLPAGTKIQIPDEAARKKLAGAFVNEMDPNCLLTSDLLLVTPAYLAERDAAESSLLKRIEELKLKPTH